MDIGGKFVGSGPSGPFFSMPVVIGVSTKPRFTVMMRTAEPSYFLGEALQKCFQAALRRPIDEVVRSRSPATDPIATTGCGAAGWSFYARQAEPA
jgi:hypothetical protein